MFPAPNQQRVEQDYQHAAEAYAAYGVDTGAALKRLAQIPLSLHCWQGDDVRGFEVHDTALDGGGILATGGHPGRARNPRELRQDLDRAISLIPGPSRVNLHAIYAETGGKPVGRDEQGPEHYSQWIACAKSKKMGLDFNPSFFAHPKAANSLTLTSPDAATREYWIRHGESSRRIASAMGAALGTPCVNNIWIPDGAKDTPYDRWGPRQRLADALDTIFAPTFPQGTLVDALEGKLFGIGLEDFTAGSHDFYLGYCAAHRKTLCMDLGHFHPTESVADKLSSCLQFLPSVLIHASRGIRWDSDHVFVYNDEARALCAEAVRGGALDRIYFSLDFFDASINRVAAWVIGARAFRKALLAALLEPDAMLRQSDTNGAQRLGLLDTVKTLPVGAVWNYFCVTQSTPPAAAWLNDIAEYEKGTQAKRV